VRNALDNVLADFTGLSPQTQNELRVTTAVNLTIEALLRVIPEEFGPQVELLKAPARDLRDLLVDLLTDESFDMDELHEVWGEELPSLLVEILDHTADFDGDDLWSSTVAHALGLQHGVKGCVCGDIAVNALALLPLQILDELDGGLVGDLGDVIAVVDAYMQVFLAETRNELLAGGLENSGQQVAFTASDEVDADEAPTPDATDDPALAAEVSAAAESATYDEDVETFLARLADVLEEADRLNIAAVTRIQFPGTADR
jgi:hypothetical protein